MSFKIEKIKLPLTMPHPGEAKVVKCPTNAGEACAVGIDGAITLIVQQSYSE